MITSNFSILRIADAFFGIFAGFTICSGLLRTFYFGKGSVYYLSNPLFKIKFSLFILVGLISIYPTIIFFKLRKPKVDFIQVKNIKIILILLKIELALLLLIPFLAVLVAKGIEL